MASPKTIWMINQYATTPDTGPGGRHYAFCRELAAHGHQVVLIAGSHSHIMRRTPNLRDWVQVEPRDGFWVCWLDVLRYRHRHSVLRAFNWALFAARLRRLAGHLEQAPDIIYYSSPSLLGYMGAEMLASHYQIPLVFEVRDIWPLTLQNLFNKSSSHPVVRLMQLVEDRAYRRADAIVSNLSNASEHVQARGADPAKVHWIPNGVSLQEFADAEPLATSLAACLPASGFVVGYAGTMGPSNGLDALFEAARLLKDAPGLRFVLVGQGAYRSKLERLAKQAHLSNLHFFDPVPKSQFQALLQRFDACYAGGPNKSQYRFGIAATKIAEYMYAKRPVLLSYSGPKDPVSASGAGYCVPADDGAALAAAIAKLQASPAASRRRMGELGHAHLLTHQSYERLATQVESLCLALIERSKGPVHQEGTGTAKSPLIH